MARAGKKRKSKKVSGSLRFPQKKANKKEGNGYGKRIQSEMVTRNAQIGGPS